MKYIKPTMKEVKMEPQTMIACSCNHECVGTVCNCGCKGWKSRDYDRYEEDYEGD